MSCKYPKDSRMYYSCILCDDQQICKDTIALMSQTTSDIPMPEVKPSKDVIPSASQANQMTKENIENCCTQELIEITKKIKKAIANGDFSISGEGNLKHETVERLKKLGYKVDTGCTRNESYWSISWK